MTRWDSPILSIRSDVDLGLMLQLIIHVPFAENVRIKSIALKLGTFSFLYTLIPTGAEVVESTRSGRSDAASSQNLRKPFHYSGLCRYRDTQTANQHKPPGRGDRSCRISHACGRLHECAFAELTFCEFQLCPGPIPSLSDFRNTLASRTMQSARRDPVSTLLALKETCDL